MYTYIGTHIHFCKPAAYSALSRFHWFNLTRAMCPQIHSTTVGNRSLPAEFRVVARTTVTVLKKNETIHL